LKNKIVCSLRNGEVRAYTLIFNGASSQATAASKIEWIGRSRVKIL
jgi:hypothetical protein